MVSEVSTSWCAVEQDEDILTCSSRPSGRSPPPSCSRSPGPGRGGPPSPSPDSRGRRGTRLQQTLSNTDNWVTIRVSQIKGGLGILLRQTLFIGDPLYSLLWCLDWTVCSPTQILSVVEQPLAVTWPSRHRLQKYTELQRILQPITSFSKERTYLWMNTSSNQEGNQLCPNDLL